MVDAGRLLDVLDIPEGRQRAAFVDPSLLLPRVAPLMRNHEYYDYCHVCGFNTFQCVDELGLGVFHMCVNCNRRIVVFGRYRVVRRRCHHCRRFAPFYEVRRTRFIIHFTHSICAYCGNGRLNGDLPHGLRTS